MPHPVTIWRHERKAKAAALGVALEDLPDRRDKVRTDRSCYYSDKHHKFLYHAAWRIIRKFENWNLDVDELVNVGWYQCARYHEDVSREYERILIKMYRFAVSRITGVCFDALNVPVFVKEPDKTMRILPFRREERLSINDDTVERVSEILESCSSDEKELLRLRFYWGLTFKEIGDIYGVGQSNMTIKYQKMFERIKKRLRGEPTRGLRTKLIRA